VRRARALLVGGNDDFLDSVAAWVTLDARLEVVGRARSGSEALERLQSSRADVLLMDVTLPDMSGFEATRRIKLRAAAPLVVLLSFHDSQAARLETWAVGADGFVPTSAIADSLIPLVVELLSRRGTDPEEKVSGRPTRRVPPADVTE
jgi:DNA-binding NarL/FixJ family response regulator